MSTATNSTVALSQTNAPAALQLPVFLPGDYDRLVQLLGLPAAHPVSVSNMEHQRGTQREPAGILLQFLGDKKATLTLPDGVVVPSVRGAIRVLKKIFNCSVVEVCQPIPNSRAFIFRPASSIDQLLLRAGVFRLSDTLGFTLRALPPLGSFVVPFKLTGLQGPIDLGMVSDALLLLDGVDAVRSLERVIVEGAWTGECQGTIKSTHPRDDGVENMWLTRYFDHVISIQDSSIHFFSRPPCSTCGENDHQTDECMYIDLLALAPVFALVDATLAPAVTAPTSTSPVAAANAAPMGPTTPTDSSPAPTNAKAAKKAKAGVPKQKGKKASNKRGRPEGNDEDEEAPTAGRKRARRNNTN